ncbi:MAG: carboxypeptidase regulatory-like domain-containing protein [Blastocatellia bacterium]|nr:carboxypeptidase regulatory-like domain-containing protein [Blastocatellia bacterium]
MQSRTRGGPTQAASIMLALLVVLTAVFQTPVYAQVETGQIAGTVADPQGAVIAGATIVVQSKGTGATRTQKSMGDGSYIFSNLQPGDYEVRVEGSGFGAKTVPVRVTVGTKTTVDVALDVTGTGEVVDVVAGDQGVQVNTENQVLSTVVSEKQIRELPTITRNPYALVQLAGTAVAVDPEAQDPNTTTSDRGAGFNINGQRSSSTNVMLDGADNNDTYGSDIGNAVPLDSVQEFTVLTNNFSAEYGRAGGGVVNVATKAGTNEFHGTIYEFNRISALATDSANLKGQFVPSKKGVFTRNQFGYSVGGPVVKDKLQFFQSTEWLRVRSQDTSIALVPTAELISQTPANVQAFFAPFALGPSSPGRVFTVGEIGGTPGGPFSQLPSNLPAFQEVFYTIPADAGGGFPQDQYQIVGRADWNISDRTTMYGRYAYQNITFAEGALSFSPYQGFNSPSITKNHNFLVSATHVWSDNFVSQSKFAFSRVANDQPLGEQPATPSLYLQQNVKSTLLGRDVGLPGYYPFSPSAAIPAGGPANMFQVYQDQTWTIGSHAIRFGGSFIRIHDDHFFGAFESAVQELGGSSFAGLDNLLLGQTARFRVAIDPKGSFPGDTVQFPVSAPQFLRNNRYNEGALYINDSWKIHPRVTLNLGLRWDYFGVQHSADPSLDSNFHLGSGSTIFEQIRNGEVFLSADNPAGGLWGKDNDNFGPRIGIAWDVFGDGKTSLRGGYGLSFERNFGNVTFNVIQNPPAYAVLDLINTVPISIDNLGPAAGAGGSFTLPRTSLRYVDENIKTAYAHFWSASLEHEFANGLVGSLEYSGSKGVDLYSLEDLNGPFSAIHYGLPLSPGSNGRLNEQYSSINARRNGGFSNYNSLTVGVQSRVFQSTGLQFLAKYTWSHAIDNLSSTFSDGSNLFNLGLIDPFNPETDKGNADFDVRHRFISSGIWEVPFAKNTDGWQKHLLDGWQLSYIVNVRTGAPFTIFDCTNGFLRCNRLLQAGPIDIDGQGTTAPQNTQGNLYTYIDLTNQLSQAGAYADPLTGIADYGPYPSNMTARNNFRRPGYWNLDGGLYKNIALSERYSIQLRGEFYNVFNHANLYINDGQTDISASPFITAYKEGRRQVQLAIKFIF